MTKSKPSEITKLLIANRGEIAVRIAKTARRLGMGTVGVYSDADANAAHTDAMDQAVSLGGNSPAESYLRADAVIAAAVDTGCDAIHPGYGFLAENAAFAQAVNNAGLIWVGPTPDQITLLGDKVAAKKAAAEAGLPTPTGEQMPVIVKAAAGGGGRGMRIVRDASELEEAKEAAAREALAAFGDGAIFIEPYIENGRHVEVQIMGDSAGNVVHLGERECSIQRRNQKVVEESPSPGISAEVRTQLTNGALALAKHVGYENAGTVEFLVGDDGTINFLEVNTRLQVEHPVTEAVTGLDLVEMQLRVAAGHPLGITQEEISFSGHAIEVRLVAEDPTTGWMPSVGTVQAFSIGEGVRVDSGIAAGDEISPSYDSLVAKIIAHAPTRRAAAAQLSRSLSASTVTGVSTNLNCLVAILNEPDFLAGKTPTSYLGTHAEVEQSTGPQGPRLTALLLAATFARNSAHRNADQVWGFAPSGWRNLPTQGQRQSWTCGPTTYDVEFTLNGNTASATVKTGETHSTHAVRLHRLSPAEVAIEVDGIRTVVNVHQSQDVAHASSPVGSATFAEVPRFEVHDLAAGGSGPVCPLPGTVLSVNVSPGDQVSDGQVLMVVEAMKMEHKITATKDAVVTDVMFAVGDRVDQGDLLVSLADAGAPTESDPA